MIERVTTDGMFRLDGGEWPVSTIVRSIRERLLTLPAETVVHTGHGDTTTVGQEAPDIEEWLRRGH